MLNSSQIIGFVATKNAQKARAFYVDALGLDLVEDDQFAMEVNANGNLLSISQHPK